MGQVRWVLLFSVSLALLVSCLPRRADAVDRQLLLGGDLAYAHEFGDQSRPGGGAGAHVRYFLTDYVAVGGNVAWAAHAAEDAAGEAALRQVISASVGFLFYADIIRFVPYAGLLTGVAVSLQSEAEVAYLAQVSIGGFLLVSPAFTVGLDLAYQALIGEEILPARLVASIQLSWRHIFF